MPSNSGTLPNLVSIPKGYSAPNSVGMELANLAAWHLQRIGQMGMLAAPPEGSMAQPLGSAPNPVSTTQRVWVNEPPGSIPFDEQGERVLSGVVSPAATVMSVKVPEGFDGVIKWISNNLVPGPASVGTLLWAITINGRAVRNFGHITQEKGTVYQGRQISPIRVFSGDVMAYTVQQLAAGVTGSTVVSLTGYYYPSKGIS